ncbi:NnrS family protein [Lampropedia cohaerens]|uniref:NnrS family protein n=1 Tax=Lampropedia cohaerens TaxID=1610491 RepID=A0A0U1Q243_9BURK|nr:NnrS family protein [Lampropedia cohaerens]KKW68820.1 NnrS family protein [Lampropedia cohaerens]
MSELLQIAEPPLRRPAPPQWRAFLELGFRPLYLLGCGWAALSVGIWVFAPQWLVATMAGVIWHAHEMLWGFIATIAVGFLLTAAATWTGSNPMQGRSLAALVLLWLMARLGFLLPGTLAFAIGAASELLFFLSAAVALARVIHISRSVRNYGVAPLLVALAVTDAAYLWASWRGDYLLLMHWLHIGMLCMALVAVLVSRRVIPFFASRAIAGLKIPMHVSTGRVQLVSGFVAVIALLMQWQHLAALALSVTGALALWQTLAWKPWRVASVPLLWILYLGYAGLGTGLLLAAAQRMEWVFWAAWPAHVIGMAGFSVLIIGMVTRTALGHLGRPLRTDRLMVAIYLLVLLAGACRLLALWLVTLSGPWQVGLLHASAGVWVLAFGLYLWRFAPMLIRPRIDRPAGQAVPVSIQPARRAG